MVITTPSTAATIPSPGKASAMVDSAAIGSRRFAVMDLQIHLHHMVDIHGFHASRNRHAQRVA